MTQNIISNRLLKKILRYCTIFLKCNKNLHLALMIEFWKIILHATVLAQQNRDKKKQTWGRIKLCFSMQSSFQAKKQVQSLAVRNDILATKLHEVSLMLYCFHEYHTN